MRWKISTVATLAVALGACAPDVPEDPAPDVVVARFDPSASPAVVPSPTDLARDPATGRLAIPLPPNATPADEAFVGYLNSLDGYPAATGGSATFAGELDAASVTGTSVRVIDLTEGAPVSAELGLSVTEGDAPISTVHVAGPGGGWTSGHQYLVAIVAGEGGVRGTGGRDVVGSPIWAFVRAENSLVTCEDLAASDCRRSSGLLPDDASAVQLEQLRRAYAPLFEMLASQGVARSNVVHLWTFTIASGASPIFDPGASPPRVPTPTDLAIDPATGLVNAPVDPSASEAQQEFVRDYLNTLDGFPVGATAQVGIAGGALDAATLNPATLPVVDVTDLLGGGTGAVAQTTTYDAASGGITITPDAGAWTKGHTYAVALVGGESGIKNDAGVPLMAPTAWALARSPAPLVTCEDLTAADCALAISAAPITLEQGLALERLRRGYAPLLAALGGMGVAADDVALLWTFSIVSQPEVTFDPANAVIPFPNDLLLDRTDPEAPKVNLPGADPGTLQGQIIAGLNTLDGFGLTATIVSENSDALAATDVGDIDDATLAGGAGLVPLTPGALTPSVTVCISCDSSEDPLGGAPPPAQLQFVPTLPLDEQTTYAGYVSTATRSTDGKAIVANPVFALVRSSAPLVDEAGKSTVDVLSDAQASALEPLRLGMKPVIDALAASGVARRDLSLAFAYTTQTGYSFLRFLNALPATAPTAVTDMAVHADYTSALGGAGTVYEGKLTSLNLLTDFTGPFSPAPQPETLRFLLVVPAGTAPSGGWPVTIFSHGLTGSRHHVMGIAPSMLGIGHATLAIDLTHHGDRTDCVGANPLAPVCNPLALATCDAATHRCLDPSGETAYFPKSAEDPTALHSGWNIIEPTNLFATRDRFRQQVIDFSQLVRILQADGFDGSGVDLSPTGISYVGQSLGGILGTLFTAASPDVGHAALNVPGGSLVDVLLESPSFADQAAAFKALLASQGMPEGSPGYDNFINIARWIIDPADPINAAHQLLNGPVVPAGREVLIQYITEDQTIPNTTTEMLIAAAQRGDDQVLVSLFETDLATLPPAQRHGFLFNPATAPEAQGQVSHFISTGNLP